MLRGLESCKDTFASDEYIGKQFEKLAVEEDNAYFKKTQRLLQVIEDDFKNPSPCICQRPSALVVCALCGAFGDGRVAKICPKHPHTVISTDFQKCSVCAYARFLRECSYPKK